MFVVVGCRQPCVVVSLCCLFSVTPILLQTNTNCVQQVLHDLGVDLDVQRQVGTTAAMVASSKGHVESVKLLHEMKADFTVRDNYGSTAVHYAAYHGHTEVLKVISRQ